MHSELTGSTTLRLVGMNTGSRLLVTLDALLSYDTRNGGRACDAWAAALGLGPPGEQDLDDEVALALQAVRSEIALLKARLESEGIPQELFHGQLERLRTIAAPTAMHGQWHGMVGNINPPDVRLAVGWAAVHLPDDEAELGSEALQGLIDEFDRLATDMVAADLPPAMRAYVAKQLRTLRSAFRMYRVRGIAVVHEALEQAYGAARKAQPAMAAESAAAPQARGFVAKVNGAISRALTVCDSVDKMRKGGSALLNMAEGLQKLLEVGKDAM